MLQINQPQPAPKFRFVQYFNFTRIDSCADVIIERYRLEISGFVASDDQIRLLIRPLNDLAATLANQSLGISPRHARKTSRKHDTLAGENRFALLYVRTAHADICRKGVEPHRDATM